MGKYRLTRSARENLTEVVAFTAADNIDAALAMYDRFEHTFALLAENPRAGLERSEIAVDLRSFPTGSYVLLYRALPGEVLIVRIVRAARDFDEEVNDQ